MQNIEWMHSLILFFHEILAKPDPDYFEFAWELLGHFIIKYPTTKFFYFIYFIFIKSIRIMQLFSRKFI